MIVSVMCFRTFPWSYSHRAEISETSWYILIYHPKIFLNVYLRPYWMEITNVMAVLNAMALINVHPSITHKQGNQSQSKVLLRAPLRQLFILELVLVVKIM